MENKPPDVDSKKQFIKQPDEYYTSDDVEDGLVKLLQPPPQPLGQYILPISSLPKSNSPAAVYETPEKPVSPIILTPDELEKRFGPSSIKQIDTAAGEVKIPFFIAPFANRNLERADGKFAKVIKLGLKDAKGQKSEVYVIFLLYEMIIGAIGGMLMGIETGRFSMEEVGRGIWGPTYENIKNQSLLKNGVVRSAIAYKGGKRMVAGGMLYNFVHKNIEQSRNKRDWLNSAMAGGVCGGLYGVRGGMRGSAVGATVFGMFAGTSGIFDQMTRSRGK